MGALLAVDLGVRTGLALYRQDGRLQWYRSRNFGSAARLGRAVHSLLADTPDIAYLILEGGGHLADLWSREAGRRGIPVLRIAAEEWRRGLLYPRERCNGPRAKAAALQLARAVIDWSGARRPTSLRHDAAEAVLIGMWALLHLGWLARLPGDLRRS